MRQRAVRGWARVAVGSALVASALVAAPGAMACACGGMVGPDGYDQRMERETAVLHWDGTRETVHLQLQTRSSATDAGLLLPTPHPAEVVLGEEELFTDLEAASRPRWEERQHLFGPPALFADELDGAAGGAPPGADGGVQVLSTEDLGPLEATVLTADDPGALDEWLAEHEFVMSEEFESVVTPYIEDDWAFVAVRLTTEGQALDGDLPPLQVTFDAEELVYPMRMSQAAQDRQQTRTYVLSDHKVDRTDPTAGAGLRTLAFAGEVDPSAVSSELLAGLLADTPYLTTIDHNFPDPGEIVSDFTFARAADDEPFQVVNYTDSYLIPVDVAILGGVLLLGVTGGIVWYLRRSRA